MFTNDQMDRVPDEIAKLFREMENDITFDIVNRLSELNKITRTIDYQLYVATQMRTYDHDLRQVIQKYTNKSQKQMEDLFNEVLSEGYAQDADLYKAQGIPFVPFEENDSMQQMVRALVTQADDDLSNITRTLGIAFRDGTKENLTQYFRDTLNRATVEMMAGAFSYDSTMKRVITELSNSGIRTISYESGHVDRVDVAASRAVRTGFNQAVSKISDANAEALDTEYFEVSAHLTARPSHALWQGKVYSRKQLVEICGLGTGPGLLGWNCRHSYYPFIPGVSKRTYTDEQLADIYQKSLETKEWRGQKYTGYEATQYQRMLERRMRVQDEKIRLMKQAGVDNNEIADLKTKHEATYQEYKQFSEKMGLPEQMNRVFNSEVKKTSSESERGSMVIDSEHVSKEKYGVNWDAVNSKEYREKFDAIPGIDEATRDVLCQKSRDMLKHRDSTDVEDMYLIDPRSGKVAASQTKSEYYAVTEEDKYSKVNYNKSLYDAIKQTPNGVLISIHNHPESLSPSGDDFASLGAHGYRFGIVACHDGSLYYYYATKAAEKEFTGQIFDMTVEKYKNRGYFVEEAYEMAIAQLSSEFGLGMVKL